MFIKNDIRQINRDLDLIKNEDTNAKLTTQTFDKDICELCNNINSVLDERRRIAVECEKSNAEFKRAITNISHDMRTPLTSALGYIQMLADENLPDEKRAEYIGIVESRLKSLSALMNNLFEFAKIIENNAEPELQKVNIANTVRDALSEFYGELTAKGFAVETDIPDNTYCLCDEQSLRRILQNLLKNTCVHGKEILRVSVRADISKSVIEIANKADLSGVDVAKMFERFYTADASRSAGNTGLGLAIAKELTERMGGIITATAAEKGDMLVVRVKI